MNQAVCCEEIRPFLCGMNSKGFFGNRGFALGEDAPAPFSSRQGFSVAGRTLKPERPMNQKIRIVLVEDHAIIREGLHSLFSSEKDFEVVGEAEEGRSALRLVENLRPDLVVTDLSMPQMDGIDLISTLKKANPKIRIIALTVHRNDEYVLAALKAGADGYILKEANYSELITAARTVLKGKHYLSPDVSGNLIRGYLEGRELPRGNPPWEALSKREREIVALIAEGETNKQIADRLCISVKTVETHRYKIMSKLNVHNAAALITVALERGLIRR
jgi:two-component system, NarL family, response regulator NreC